MMNAIEPLLRLCVCGGRYWDHAARRCFNCMVKGQDRNLTLGDVIVTGHKVDVMVYLADLSDATLKGLKNLGFEQSAESKATRLLVGTIDVRKLTDLAKLDAVVRVTNVPAEDER